MQGDRMSEKNICRQISREDAVIRNAVEAADGFNDLSQANRYFLQLCESISGFSKLDNNVYHYKEFYINVGKRVFMARHAEGLRVVADFELSCIPELMAYIWLNNGEDMVLITRVKGSEGQRLCPCEDKKRLPETVRCRLLGDADRLMEKGYAIAALTDVCSVWYYVENSGKVIFSNCELAYVSEKAKSAYRKKVLNVLGLS